MSDDDELFEALLKSLAGPTKPRRLPVEETLSTAELSQILAQVGPTHELKDEPE
jgi:hypothetical protein